jgi:hypothetical protein
MPRKTQKRKTQKRKTQKRQTQKRRLQLGGRFHKKQNKELRDILKSFGFLSSKQRSYVMYRFNMASQQFGIGDYFDQLKDQLKYFYENRKREGIKEEFMEWIEEHKYFEEIVETDKDDDSDEDD